MTEDENSVVTESSSSTSLNDVYTVDNTLDTSGYNDYQLMLASCPQAAPYSSIMHISHDMAMDLYERATRVVHYISNDSLAVNAIKYKNFVVSRLKKRPERQEFNCEDVILALISIIGFLYNVVVDLLVTTMYWREGSKGFALTSITALIVPLIIVNFISMMWYKDEDHECSVEPVILQRTNRWSGPVAWGLCGWMHALLLGQVYRTVIMIYVGIKSWGVDRARERRKSEVSNAIASYYQQMEQSDGGSTSSDISNAVPHLSRGPSLDDALPLPECEPCVDYYSMFVHQEFDIAILDMLDGFLHDGTQVVLQVYMILSPDAKHEHEDEDEDDEEAHFREIAQIQSALTALVTLSWCVSEYSRAKRGAHPEKRKLNLLGMLMMFIWRLFTLVPRVFAFSLFASCVGYYMIVFVGVHWFLMAVWVHLQRAADGSRLKMGEVITCLVLGYVYIFCFFRLPGSNEPTRVKYIFFYSLIFVENSLMLYSWYSHTKDTYGLTMLSTMTGLYFVGLMFMLMYYKWVHPQDHLPDRTRRPRLI